MSKAKRPPLDIEKVRQEYREGRSLRDIAAEVGYSHVHVRRLLQSAGEPIRKMQRYELQQRMRDAKDRMVDLRRRAAIALYKAGFATPEIAIVVGKTQTWVQAHLRDASIYVPPLG